MKKTGLIIAAIMLVIAGLGAVWFKFNRAKFILMTSDPVSEEKARMAERTMYTAEQVAEHSTESDCWLIINGGVYDATAFAKIHPGEAKRIIVNCGTDATDMFKSIEGGKGHSGQAMAILKTLKVGNFSDSQ